MQRNQDPRTLGMPLDASTKMNRLLGLGFVAFLTFILLRVAGTTDLMIFLPESTLGILGAELPLVAFYLWTPFVILGFHFLVLLHLKHHQDRYDAWRDAAEASNDDSPRSVPLLINSLGAYRRFQVLGILQKALVAGSYFFFPLMVMTCFLSRFNDYHNFAISTVQFFAIALDALLCILFYGKAFRRRSPSRWGIFRVGNLVNVTLMLVALWHWSMALCLHGRLDDPHYMEWLHGQDGRLYGPRLPHIDLSGQAKGVGVVDGSMVVHYLQDNAHMDYAQHKARMGNMERLKLTGRDLRYADLSGVNLAGANMRFCLLDWAQLEETDLSGTNLERADLRHAFLGDAWLERANLIGADLREAFLLNAHLEMAVLQEAKFDLALMDRAHLEGSVMWGASLKGASLQLAHLEGTQLWDVRLDGADLNSAHLAYASLSGAQLKGTSLQYAHLEGADLFRTDLVGANLNGAHLEGATFMATTLFASSFSDAYLFGVEMDDETRKYFEDNTLLRNVDWNTPPDLNLLFADSLSNGLRNHYPKKWREYVDRMKVIDSLSVDREWTPPQGISEESFTKLLPEVACMGLFIGQGVLQNFERSRDATTAAMCVQCPALVKEIFAAEPNAFQYLRDLCR